MKKILVVIIIALMQMQVFAKETLSADSLMSLGTYYYMAERYIDAMDVLAKAMDKADQDSNDKVYTSSLMTLGNIYTMFDDYDQALHYYTVCLDKALAVKADSLYTRIRTNMLICYAMLGKQKEAEACYKAIGTIHMENENLSRFYTYLNQALLMKARKYPKGAIFFHTQALNYALGHNMNGRYVAAEMGQIGTMYEELGDMKAAEEWYLKCKDYAEKGNLMGPLTTACEKLASIYRREGKDNLYVKYNKLYVEYSDSFFQPKDFNSKRSLVSNYENRLKDRQVNELKDQNTTLTLVIATIATLMIALIVLLVYIYKVNRRLQQTQRLLIKKHQEHSHQLEVQNEIFTSMENASAGVSVPPNDETDTHPEEELLNKQQADMLLMSIAQVMEKTDTICAPDFSLSMLAQMVGSNTKYVSWVINKNYGKNFKTYLNEYRIRMASTLLADTEKYGNLTIASIAERVGYKSPTSFHQAFKKIYGMTPAAYVKLAREKDGE